MAEEEVAVHRDNPGKQGPSKRLANQVRANNYARYNECMNLAAQGVLVLGTELQLQGWMAKKTTALATTDA